MRVGICFVFLCVCLFCLFFCWFSLFKYNNNMLYKKFSDDVGFLPSLRYNGRSVVLDKHACVPIVTCMGESFESKRATGDVYVVGHLSLRRGS